MHLQAVARARDCPPFSSPAFLALLITSLNMHIPKPATGAQPCQCLAIWHCLSGHISESERSRSMESNKPDLPKINEQSRKKVFHHKSVTQGLEVDGVEAVSLWSSLAS